MKAKYIYQVTKNDGHCKTPLGVFSKPILAVAAAEKPFENLTPSRHHKRPTQTILNILREEGTVTEMAYPFKVTIQKLELDRELN